MAENKSVVIIEADENSVTEQIIAEIYDAVSKRLAVILNLNYLENIDKEEKIFRFMKDNYGDRVRQIAEHVYVIAVREDRLIAIGDIHAEIDKLNNLLEKLAPTENDKLVFLGDYIDRGQDSVAVVERLLELQKQTNCIFLKGNHEQMFLDALKTMSDEAVAKCVINGGAETLKDYLQMKKDDIEKFKRHIKFFKSLKLYYMTEKYFFVHAGLCPMKNMIEQEEDDFLWLRDNFVENSVQIQQKVIFGHTVFDSPYIEDDKIGINTGCGIVDEAPLTAYICNENKFIQSD
ncbi:MAG: serine/threonine protein phosphatase [Candidatus Gastranaerophilales bacterium]|nr:serine/threonine protein phosphatase [Candidatus Gastranaerophilales bacterium]